jgi:hypothetical protein
VKVIVGVSGAIQEAIEKYKSGQFQPTTKPNAPSHFGAGSGTGPGYGTGFGQGMGPGRGMGMGRRQGPGFGGGPGFSGGGRFDYPPPPSYPSQPDYNLSAVTPREELAYLKKQAEMMRRQLAEILTRLEALEKKNKE